MDPQLQQKIIEALRDPKNVGEMSDADSVGTAGSPGCGDMLRMWLKFKEGKNGQKIIDKATFQSFGCETAIAVASVATELLAGKTMEEARGLSGEDLAAPLGSLPPMKIHCATLVEEALRQALDENKTAPPQAATPSDQNHLLASVTKTSQSAGSKIVFLDPQSI